MYVQFVFISNDAFNETYSIITINYCTAMSFTSECCGNPENNIDNDTDFTSISPTELT